MATSSDDMSQRLEHSPSSAWVPQTAGDKIIGTVRALGTCTSDFTGKDVPTVDIETDNGVRQVRAYHSVLRRELNDQGPSVGDFIGIRYDGLLKKKDGSGSYHDYRVEVDRADTVSDTDESASPF